MRWHSHLSTAPRLLFQNIPAAEPFLWIYFVAEVVGILLEKQSKGLIPAFFDGGAR